jgi:hypothetical protein
MLAIVPTVTPLPLAPAVPEEQGVLARAAREGVAKDALKVSDQLVVAVHDAQQVSPPHRTVPAGRDRRDLGQVVLAAVLA